MHWRRKWQPLQCSCLENPRDGGSWWAAVYGVAESRTRLKWHSSNSRLSVKQRSTLNGSMHNAFCRLKSDSWRHADRRNCWLLVGGKRGAGKQSSSLNVLPACPVTAYNTYHGDRITARAAIIATIRTMPWQFKSDKVKVAQSCPTLCNPTDYTVHGILQATILEWVAIPFSRGSSQTRDWTQVSCIAGGFFTSWATL